MSSIPELATGFHYLDGCVIEVRYAKPLAKITTCPVPPNYLVHYLIMCVCVCVCEYVWQLLGVILRTFVYDRGITYSFLSKEISCARLKNKTYYINKLDRNVLPAIYYNSWGYVIFRTSRNRDSWALWGGTMFLCRFVLYTPVLFEYMYFISRWDVYMTGEGDWTSCREGIGKYRKG
jgi:hypothetical protein